MRGLRYLKKRPNKLPVPCFLLSGNFYLEVYWIHPLKFGLTDISGDRRLCPFKNFSTYHQALFIRQFTWDTFQGAFFIGPFQKEFVILNFSSHIFHLTFFKKAFCIGHFIGHFELIIFHLAFCNGHFSSTL